MPIIQQGLPSVGGGKIYGLKNAIVSGTVVSVPSDYPTYKSGYSTPYQYIIPYGDGVFLSFSQSLQTASSSSNRGLIFQLDSNDFEMPSDFTGSLILRGKQANSDYYSQAVPITFTNGVLDNAPVEIKLVGYNLTAGNDVTFMLLTGIRTKD